MSLQPLPPDAQETVLKSRQIIDDRPLRRLLKRYTTLLTSPTASTLALHRASLSTDLAAYHAHLTRLLAITHSTLARERSLYEAELRALLAAQHTARAEVDALKRTLARVKLERTQKLGYDAVASSIAALPTRRSLGATLEKLEETLRRLRREEEEYEAVGARARRRVGEVVASLGGLAADLGYEVGEREREEVNRGEGEGEGDGDGEGEGEGSANDQPGEHQGEGESTSDTLLGRDRDLPAAGTPAPSNVPASSTATQLTRSGSSGGGGALNAAAPPFLPSSSASLGPFASTGRKRPLPATASSTTAASDEEGQVDDGLASSGSRVGGTAKRQKPQPARAVPSATAGEEGEVDPAGAVDSEEEEGSILPPANPSSGAKRHVGPSGTRVGTRTGRA